MKNFKEIAKIQKDKNEEVRKGPFYFLIWVLKIQIVIFAVVFIMGIIFNMIPDKSKFVIKYNIEKNFKSNINNRNYTYENIRLVLMENNNINEQEKDFINKVLQKEIEENIEYIDLSETLKRIKNLDVCYNKKYLFNEKNGKYQLNNPKIEYQNIAGDYVTLLNKINIYEKVDNDAISSKYNEEVFAFSSASKEVYFHELNHLISKNTFSTTMDIFAKNLESKKNSKIELVEEFTCSAKKICKNIFFETINELFTREYLEEYLEEKSYERNNESYNSYMNYAYALAEIISEDILREYKFYDNQSLIISELLEIDNNIDEVYKLITSINSVGLYENLSDELKQENYKKIHDGYSYFYEKKYSKNMSDDLTMLLYFYDTPIQTKEERDTIRKFLELDDFEDIIEIIPKGYVSEYYKEKHRGVQVNYIKDGQEKNLEITKES